MTLEEKIATRLVIAYIRNPKTIADACDQFIDRSVNLLGWIRELSNNPENLGSMDKDKYDPNWTQKIHVGDKTI